MVEAREGRSRRPKANQSPHIQPRSYINAPAASSSLSTISALFPALVVRRFFLAEPPVAPPSDLNRSKHGASQYISDANAVPASRRTPAAGERHETQRTARHAKQLLSRMHERKHAPHHSAPLLSVGQYVQRSEAIKRNNPTSPPQDRHPTLTDGASSCPRLPPPQARRHRLFARAELGQTHANRIHGHHVGGAEDVSDRTRSETPLLTHLLRHSPRPLWLSAR